MSTPTGPGPLLAVDRLSVTFRSDAGPVRAAREVSFTVAPGEIVAVVGESGSGKSVSARALLGLLPSTAMVEGSAQLAGVELTELRGDALRRVRGDRIAMIFQEPSTSLDPVRTVGWQVVQSLRAHRKMSRRAAHARAIELLELVGIPDAQSRVRSYPHQMSGGQKQRVMIAIAIACEPEVIIADEPTTALDVTVQAAILELLRDLRDRLGTAIVLITHNMGVVADLADRVVVMYRGQVVERTPIAPPHQLAPGDLLEHLERSGQGLAECSPCQPVDGLALAHLDVAKLRADGGGNVAGEGPRGRRPDQQ